MKEIINSSVQLQHDQARSILTLEENDPSSKLEKLYITQFPSNGFAFTLDHKVEKGRNKFCFQQLSAYVESTNGIGINKSCDLIVIWEQKGQLFALVFDLKSNKPNVKDTEKQLRNSELFLKYLFSIAESFYNVNTTITIKKTIAVTDNRAVRKGSSYAPNGESSSTNNYHIEALTICANREAYVSFKQLIR